MKNLFFKAFLALIAVFATSAAFAQCGGMNLKFLDRAGQVHCSPEAARAADRNRADVYSGSTSGVIGVQAAPVYVQQPVVVNTMPQGHVFRSCTTQEAVERSALIAGAGGLAGLLIRDNSRGAGVGAGLGLLYAMGTECRVAVPQGTAGTLGNQGVPATVNVPSNCSVDGNPKLQNLKGLTQEQCAEIAKASVAQKTDTDTNRKPVSATDVKVDTSTGTATADTCAWVHPRSKQRFDKPSNDGRPCIDFVKEVAGNNGYAIATRQ